MKREHEIVAELLNTHKPTKYDTEGYRQLWGNLKYGYGMRILKTERGFDIDSFNAACEGKNLTA